MIAAAGARSNPARIQHLGVVISWRGASEREYKLVPLRSAAVWRDYLLDRRTSHEGMRDDGSESERHGFARSSQLPADGGAVPRQ